MFLVRALCWQCLLLCACLPSILGGRSLILYVLLLLAAWLRLLFLFLWILRNRYSVDETLACDSVIVDSIKCLLKEGQVFIKDLIATVITNPVRKVIYVDEAHVVSIHVGKETFTIELKLVALLISLCICLNHKAKDSSELLEPSTLEQVLLFNAQVGRSRIGHAVSAPRLQSLGPFAIINTAIIIVINDLNESLLVGQLDVVLL